MSSNNGFWEIQPLKGFDTALVDVGMKRGERDKNGRHYQIQLFC